MSRSIRSLLPTALGPRLVAGAAVVCSMAFGANALWADSPGADRPSKVDVSVPTGVPDTTIGAVVLSTIGDPADDAPSETTTPATVNVPVVVIPAPVEDPNDDGAIDDASEQVNDDGPNDDAADTGDDDSDNVTGDDDGDSDNGDDDDNADDDDSDDDDD